MPIRRRGPWSRPFWLPSPLRRLLWRRRARPVPPWWAEEKPRSVSAIFAVGIIGAAAVVGVFIGIGWQSVKEFGPWDFPTPGILGDRAPDAAQAPARRTVPTPAVLAVRTSAGFSGRVVRVVDGDTFRMDCCNTNIRLWGIDAPEWNRPGGSAATAALRSLIAGQTLTCRRRDTDRYGRIVGQCALPDGTDLARRLLQTGTVREYCFFSRNHYRTC